jgi:hypothetical protein
MTVLLMLRALPPNARPSSAHATAKAWRCAVIAALMVAAMACTPTVRVATDDPITINLNVNIRHEILVKVERDLDHVFASNSDIF